MLNFFESTWPVLWLLAILILLRWFHINALAAEAEEEAKSRRPGRASTEANPQAI
ncbi:MAG TPA: hypothetical protein VMP68_26435 [Candidatus Eisenbacteria bacterium]|nr:hypothetical protein [Candidatus Eisenbacteria bacterium]